MSSTAVVLVLCAALCHAAWNVLAHGVSRIGLPFLWWGAVASTVIWIGVVPFTGGLGSGDLSGFLLGVGVSGILHVVYMLVLQRGYAAGQLSTVYTTARGTGPTISVVAAVLLLGERPSLIALVGVVAILTGVVMIGLADRGTGPARLPGARRRIDRGILYGLLTGVAIATYTIWDAHAVRSWDISPVAFMVGCTLIEIPIYTVAMGKRRRELGTIFREHWTKLIVFGVLSPMSYILVLIAITMAPVALVAPMRELSVILVSLFGVFVLREGRPAWRIAASLVVVAGVGLLAF